MNFFLNKVRTKKNVINFVQSHPEPLKRVTPEYIHIEYVQNIIIII